MDNLSKSTDLRSPFISTDDRAGVAKICRGSVKLLARRSVTAPTEKENASEHGSHPWMTICIFRVRAEGRKTEHSWRKFGLTFHHSEKNAECNGDLLLFTVDIYSGKNVRGQFGAKTGSNAPPIHDYDMICREDTSRTVQQYFADPSLRRF